MTIEHVRAPAKLTTRLRIVGVRDDGYHLIDAEMITLDLFDELTIDSNGTGVSVVGPAAAASDFAVDPKNNLVTKALGLAGVDAAVSLTKNIPAGAGLGGGSADAAAVSAMGRVHRRESSGNDRSRRCLLPPRWSGPG